MFLDAAMDATTGDAPMRAPAFARVEVHFDAGAVADVWADMEARAASTVYQTRGFLLPWIAHLGAARGLRSFYLVARDATGRPTLFLPLGLARSGPVRWATYLGGRDSNLNMPLVAPGAPWTPEALKRLLREAARTAGVDLYVLKNQPAQWRTRDNPLMLLPHSPAASAAYGTSLGTGAKELFEAKLSKDTRKKLRKKEARLMEMGRLSHLVAHDDASRRRVLDAFTAQKCARFAAKGIASAFGSAAMRGFLEQASRDGAIELHALTLDERVIAVYGGGAQAGHWSGMFNSFDADPEISRASPGDLLLMRIVADLHTRGIVSMDLGIGEARYKAALCDTPIALFDSIVPVTARGRGATLAANTALAAKRAIKANPRLHALAMRATRLLSARGNS